MLLSIDPGLNLCGVAAWDEKRKELVRAQLVRSPAAPGGRDLVTILAQEVARVVTETRPGGWAEGGPGGSARRVPHPWDALTVVIELPQVYSLALSKGGTKGQNDLISVAWAAGAIVGALKPDTVHTVLPREWGALGKERGQPTSRVERRARQRLSAVEIARVELMGCLASLRHNIFDAIGIGLHALERW